MSQISIDLDQVTFMKLVRRARRIGLKPEDAVRLIATKGVPFFLTLLVGATKSRP